MWPSGTNQCYLMMKSRIFDRGNLCFYCYTRLLHILLQILLNSVICRSNLAFNHLFDQLLAWFVYIHDSSLLFQQTPELLREHVAYKVKALQRRECLGDRLRELGGVGGRQHDLNNGRWTL